MWRIWFVLLIAAPVAAKVPYGTVLGKFENVPAYSNREHTATKYGKYQCVEYVSRFIREKKKRAIPSIGSAKNLFGIAKSCQYGYLQAVENGGSIKPQPGDILCFDQLNKPDGFGHVAIISKVLTDGKKKGWVRMIEQNWRRDVCWFWVEMRIENGRYTMHLDNRRKGWTIQGWVRVH